MSPRLVSSSSLLLAVAVVVVLSGCGSAGDGPKCQPGFNFCGGTCVSEVDAANCGACGIACSATTECRRPAGSVPACVPSCASQLTGRYDNPETGAWDGISRTAATFSGARATCEAAGGRLPTATELAKLSRDTGAPGKATAGALWSLTADGPDRRYTVDVASGSGTPAAVTGAAIAARAYRCLCPSETPPAFTGTACFGPPGAPQCATPGGGAVNFDANDRLALTKAGAVWECAFFGARLPTFGQLAEAISLTPPLGGGSNTFLHTGDDDSYDRDALAQFGAAFLVGQDYYTTARPFRCAGVNDPASLPSAPLLASIHLASRGGLQGDALDAPTPLPYGDAVTACWNKGGHLPSATELAALVNSGLSNGSGNALSCADTLYNDGASWMTPTYKWSGTQEASGYDWQGTTTWLNARRKSDAVSYPYRCIYYPLAAGYQGPAETDCKGGCSKTSKAMAGTASTATYWFDLEDRAAATFQAAAASCAALGGHLPSMRDYTEIIRAGLAGTNTLLWTADVAHDGAPYRVTWTGSSNGTFTGATTGGIAAITTLVPYRCMWTNELR